MPLTRVEFDLQYGWAFEREITDFESAFQGPEYRSFNLADIDVATWDEAYLAELSLATTAATTIDLYSFTDLLYQTTGLTSVLAMALIVPWVAVASPATGPTASAGLGADNNAAGDVAWSNPTNVYTSNDSRATAVLTAGQTTHYLDCTTFGFAVPTGATITGITVSIERSGTVSNDAADTTVQLIKGGTAQGNNKASASKWPTTDAVATYGGAADLWGLALTASDVNATNFGVTIRANATAGSTVRVDHVQITVHFSHTKRGLVLSPGAANGLQWFFEDTSDKAYVPVGGAMAWCGYHGGSGTTVDATNRNLTITNRAAETIAASILLLGGT